LSTGSGARLLCQGALECGLEPQCNEPCNGHADGGERIRRHAPSRSRGRCRVARRSSEAPSFCRTATRPQYRAGVAPDVSTQGRFPGAWSDGEERAERARPVAMYPPRACGSANGSLQRPVGKAFAEKHRSSGHVSGDLFAGNVADAVCVVVDDLINSGGNLVMRQRQPALVAQEK